MTLGRGESDTRAKPPSIIDGARVLKYAGVVDAVRPTGATSHEIGGKVLGPAAALAIVQYAGESSYFLFYLDERNETVADGWHESVEDALKQAAFEYEGLTWVDVGGA